MKYEYIFEDSLDDYFSNDDKLSVNNLIINKLTKAQYDALDEKENNELYLIIDEDIN